MTRFLATADVHLGRASSKVAGPEHRAGAAWRRLCQIAQEHQVDAVLVAGDLINEHADLMAAIGDLRAGFQALGDIPVVAIAGNHDALTLTRAAAQFEGRLRTLGMDGEWQSTTIKEIEIVGRSFTRPEDLQPAKMPPPNLFSQTVVLAHGDMDGGPSKYRRHESRLVEATGGQWIFGHIHSPKRQGPNWFYTTSPQALDPGETGAHGIHLLEFDPYGDLVRDFHPISTVRYEQVEFDVSGLSLEEIEDGLAGRLSTLRTDSAVWHVRLDLVGRGRLSPTELPRLQANVQDFANQGVIVEWISAAKLRPEWDLPAIAQGRDGRARLATAILALERGDEIDPKLAQSLKAADQTLAAYSLSPDDIRNRTITAAYRVLEAIP
jgi:DNA repair exonuclease SbcCD nuclease subunit